MEKQLVVIFAWMLAKDQHIDVYIKLWNRRGFEVVVIKTSIFDVLFPLIGTHKVAKAFSKQFAELSTKYDKIIVHTFSVGSYQLGEVLRELHSNEENKKNLNLVKGVVFDSMIFPTDLAPGLSRALTLNRILQPILQSLFALYLKLFYNYSMKLYENAAEFAFALPTVPRLILFCKNDIICSLRSTEELIEKYMDCGIPVRWKCWEKSSHVLHYKNHKIEYEEQLDEFIKVSN